MIGRLVIFFCVMALGWGFHTYGKSIARRPTFRWYGITFTGATVRRMGLAWQAGGVIIVVLGVIGLAAYLT